MKKIIKSIGEKTRTHLLKRFDPLNSLRNKLPNVFFKEVNPLRHSKKIAMILLTCLVIAAFIVTSMPHLFLT